MIVNARVSIVLMLATLVVSLVLMLVPLPTLIAPFRPAFYTMTVLFWAANQPQRFGLLAAWLAGVVMDILYTTPLSEHGLAMAVATYALIKVRGWLWTMPVVQQTLLIAPILVAYEFVLFWVDGVAGLDVAPSWRWLPVISSTLLWPAWAYLLERIAEFEVE
ncbi:rod shape-determining protein MreD [Salinisphaera sp. Q1T1-3]|uniref:rod shape-determining protein MreD n=1 Tax=Salinisphaera sp. Q1T1-3 TaxID=2321229 RepID=UPI000E759F04|nr:rod shape-determining protein MreD [Salinisphaera sp. Q1T1-3]RJS94645.1 rod shape-determining protein MreD [Salinisphaera sp. Q1T1-3]